MHFRNFVDKFKVHVIFAELTWPKAESSPSKEKLSEVDRFGYLDSCISPDHRLWDDVSTQTKGLISFHHFEASVVSA